MVLARRDASPDGATLAEAPTVLSSLAVLESSLSSPLSSSSHGDVTVFHILAFSRAPRLGFSTSKLPASPFDSPSILRDRLDAV
jgi:hypothetical protein